MHPPASVLLALVLAGCDDGEPPDGGDEDGDGWTVEEHDCDDQNPDIHPEAEEVVDDGIDQDCDGYDACYRDDDHDGYGTTETLTSSDGACTSYGESAVSTDCDDERPAVYPGAEEVVADGIDQDCDGNDTDADGDGHAWKEVGGDDCDDGNPDVHPGAEEVCGNGVDDDCYEGDKECPVSMDEADATFWGAEDAMAGYWVAPAGDFDGDGHLDVAISSPQDADSGGKIHVMTGPFSGEYSLDDAAIAFRGEYPTYAWAGRAMDGGLDTNGDGLGAVVFSAGQHDVSLGYGFLFEGPVEGTLDVSEADCTVVAETKGDWAGDDVAAVGDATGDGIDDWLVTATSDSSRGRFSGAAYLVSGAKRGTWNLADADAKMLGEMKRDYAGIAVGSAGDVNGDGLDDILVGADGHPSEAYMGSVYLILGPVSGTMGLENADAIVRGEELHDLVGHHVASAGDMDGDGLADILVAARGRETTYVFLSPVRGEIPISDADGSLAGDASEDDSAWAVDGAGDADGDGIPDIVIGAQLDDEAGTDAGAAWLVYGPVTGANDLEDVGTKFLGLHARDITGNSVSFVGDVDEDGLDDFLVGAYGFPAWGRDGAAYLVNGWER